MPSFQSLTVLRKAPESWSSTLALAIVRIARRLAPALEACHQNWVASCLIFQSPPPHSSKCKPQGLSDVSIRSVSHRQQTADSEMPPCSLALRLPAWSNRLDLSWAKTANTKLASESSCIHTKDSQPDTQSSWLSQNWSTSCRFQTTFSWALLRCFRLAPFWQWARFSPHRKSSTIWARSKTKRSQLRFWLLALEGSPCGPWESPPSISIPKSRKTELNWPLPACATRVWNWPSWNLRSELQNRYTSNWLQLIYLFENFRVNIVQWSEDLYEKQLIERTHNACQGLVDIVIDFGTTSRSLHRSLQCLNDGGVVLVSDEVAEKLLPKFSRKAEERKQHIEPVPTGTIEQLHELVKLVATKEVRIANLLIV